MSNRLKIVRANERDLEMVLAILDEAARWLVTKGIAGPWIPGSFSRQAFADQIARGEVYVARMGQETVGTITLQWSDELFWPKAPFDAGYVHKLALRSAYLRRGFGLQMLEWAENVSRAAGKEFLRLDCLVENSKIRSYYENLGFVHQGDVDLRGWKASLYQKKLKSA